MLQSLMRETRGGRPLGSVTVNHNTNCDEAAIPIPPSGSHINDDRPSSCGRPKIDGMLDTPPEMRSL
jgi:hypothetical protein